MVIDGKQITKVVHVHFIHGHANYYFGSIHAVFKKFSFDDIGRTIDYVEKNGLQIYGVALISSTMAFLPEQWIVPAGIRK